ncbi:glycosyltransferase [Kutzneria albida]|uniref:Uncharacterized protein n=1 Tax=Kutzneria albida DSM 43870 TaxID=1449976 RepID=W5WP03_9PSEU|nr:glycosyltransferase [Kutzneria albida]AHH99904.1 hypothetical protein KALB_6545 [Kutzneria albida DSM 43870]
MRVVFTAQSEYSHLMPVVVPVAQAARRAGHEVAVAVGPNLVAQVHDLGLQVLPLPNVVRLGEMRDNPEIARRYGIDMSMLTGVGLRTVGTPGAVAARNFAGPAALPYAQDLIEALTQWKPDLLVHEPTAFGAYYAAEALGLSRAVLDISPLTPRDPEALLAEINTQRQALDLAPTGDPDDLMRTTVAGVVPEQFYPVRRRVPGARYYRPELLPTGQRLDPAVAGLPGDRPLVLASLGSVAAKLLAGDSPVLNTIVEVLGELPVTAVVALGKDVDPRDWPGSRPDNVHLTSFVQQQLLLPACELFLTHGGFSGVRESLNAGVPTVVVPLFAEQPANADRLVELGLGTRLNVEDVDHASLTAACRTVLADPGYRSRAKAVQRQFLALPDFDQLVADLATRFG